MYSLLPRKNRDDREKESKQVLKTDEVSKTDDVSKTKDVEVSKTEEEYKPAEFNEEKFIDNISETEQKREEITNPLLSKISDMSDIPKDRTWRDYLFYNFFWGW